MKRVFLFVLSIVIALSMVGGAWAEDGVRGYKVSCVVGMVLADDGYLPVESSITPNADTAFIVCAGSRALLQRDDNDGCINEIGRASCRERVC